MKIFDKKSVLNLALVVVLCSIVTLSCTKEGYVRVSSTAGSGTATTVTVDGESRDINGGSSSTWTITWDSGFLGSTDSKTVTASTSIDSTTITVKHNETSYIAVYDTGGISKRLDTFD